MVEYPTVLMMNWEYDRSAFKGAMTSWDISQKWMGPDLRIPSAYLDAFDVSGPTLLGALRVLHQDQTVQPLSVG